MLRRELDRMAGMCPPDAAACEILTIGSGLLLPNLLCGLNQLSVVACCSLNLLIGGSQIGFHQSELSNCSPPRFVNYTEKFFL
jgi:hypothetical protein